MSETDSSSFERDPLEALAEEYFQRRQRGENPSLEEFAQRAPELADKIRDLFPALELLEDAGHPDELDPRIAPGQTIGPYRIVDELGRGGMGIVVRAEDTRLGRRVALKVLPRCNAEDAAARERFEREARLLASLSHPNLVTVYSLEEIDGVRLITMELAPGEPLSRRLERGPLPIDDSFGIARQVALALEAAHDQGVVHRDLKPGNVQVAPPGRVKVLDFGLAALVRELRSDEGGSSVSGTPGYMSPEQVDGRPTDHRTDVWALGCLLYECLTGASAFPGTTRAERMSATRCRTPDLDRLPAEVSSGLRKMLGHCLEKDVDARLGEIADARREIERAIATRMRGNTVDAASAPRGASERPGNLPLELNRLIGREQESREVTRLLVTHRLVTVTGPGGAGKTRLAIRAAHDAEASFSDGGWLVELAPIESAEDLATTCAAGLEIALDPREQPIDTLVEHLAGRTTLIVFDNCEHHQEAVAALVRRLLATCPDLRVIATSRKPLGIDGEIRVALAPLKLPAEEESDPATIARSDSVALFVERARAVHPAFRLTSDNAATVAHICRRLDGLPLAIELAACRIGVWTPERLARGLDDRFEVLTQRGPSLVPHHRTLRSLVDWSYEQLPDEERVLFRRLSVFRDGFTVERGEQVCSSGTAASAEFAPLPRWRFLDLLASLVDRSLITHERSTNDDDPRFRLLETIREYAAERLSESGERDAIRRRHLSDLADHAHEIQPRLVGPERSRWVRHLDSIHDDLRAALATAVELEACEDGLRLASGLLRFWNRGHHREGRRWCRRLLELPGSARRDLLRGRVLNTEGVLTLFQGDFDLATELLEESTSIAEEVDDKPGLSSCLLNLGTVNQYRGDQAAARSWYERALALALEIGNRQGQGVIYTGLGAMASRAGDPVTAREYFESSLSIRRELGDSRGVAIVLDNLANLELGRGRLDRARRCLNESMEIWQRLGDPLGLATCKTNIGAVALQEGQLEEATSSLEESLALRRARGDQDGVGRTLHRLSLVARRRGDYDRAREFAEESFEIATRQQNQRLLASSVTALGHLQAEQGQRSEALEHYRRALELAESTEEPDPIAMIKLAMGRVRACDGDLDSARTSIGEAAQIWRETASELSLASVELALGFCELAADDGAKAKRHFLDAFRVIRQVGATGTVPAALNALATAEARGGKPDRAAVLFGAAESLRARLGQSPRTIEQEAIDAAQASVQKQLGGRYEAEFERGAALDTAAVAKLVDGV